MILADTSVWVQHLRYRDARLEDLLAAGEIAIHPFIIGELAMGDLRPRDQMLRSLRRLPTTPMARLSEVDLLVEQRQLYATGLGYVDAHLLASAKLATEVSIWTRDRALRIAAEHLGLLAPGVTPH